MSPRKRRTLALPFLVTVAASCTVKSGSTGESTNSTANSQPAPTQAGDPQIIANPPPPGTSESAGHPTIDKNKMSTGGATTAKDETQPKPIMVVNPPPPASTLPAAPTSGGRLDVRKDETCWWYAKVDCPKDKNVTCNPPPPRQVSCPAK